MTTQRQLAKMRNRPTREIASERAENSQSMPIPSTGQGQGQGDLKRCGGVRTATLPASSLPRVPCCCWYRSRARSTLPCSLARASILSRACACATTNASRESSGFSTFAKQPQTTSNQTWLRKDCGAERVGHEGGEVSLGLRG